MSKDIFNTKKELSTGQTYYSITELEKSLGFSLSRLPFSIRVLLESVLRNCDNKLVFEDHVKLLANWKASNDEREEFPYKPARVILQDFTGVPALVDLAVMRDAMVDLGGDPKKINPLVRCDLVIDHSVQVDHFGSNGALALNEKIEFQRNKERYEFLKWGQNAFNNFRVVPPSTGIVHQVNLEYLSEGVYLNRDNNTVYPDSCVGTDSHTPMVNGLGVVAWGVGGIEAEAVMLGQAISMLVPDVIGFKLKGKLAKGATATDLVLRITEMCRAEGVVGKFVEFFGDGLADLSVANRATIGNMAPEQGSTVSFFPIDNKTLDYMRLTGRPEEMVKLTEEFSKAQNLFRDETTVDPEFTKILELDLSTIEPAVAGPKMPHDRVPLSELGPTYQDVLTAPIGPRGLGLKKDELSRSGTVKRNNEEETLGHGSVVIAAITSCTNTSNPSVMIGAGLLAKKAVEKGLKVKNYVKTSLAPGSTVVTEYLKKSGVLPYLEELGFNVVGYGCTTCIGNSGPLPQEVEKEIKDNDLVVSAVLSGNRNFEGRVHPLTRTNYLASPPLVVAFAIAGSTAMDITKDEIGKDKDGNSVYLADIWPTQEEIQESINKSVTAEIFREKYADVFKGSKAWQDIETSNSELYPWKENSTYIQKPPFFDGVTKGEGRVPVVKNAKVFGLFKDSVTTDHISPAGAIAKDSPAAKYLEENGVKPESFNSYGSRRGNDQVMVRGTFANIRLKNQLVPGSEGNITLHHGSGKEMTMFDASKKYKEENASIIILAGDAYGSGSSRDWAAKGPYLQGVKAVIAKSYERIHRSNLIGMGILPFEFESGQGYESIGIKGDESFDFELGGKLEVGQEVKVIATDKNGDKKEFIAISRVDTPVEIDYIKDGGILSTVLKSLA